MSQEELEQIINQFDEDTLKQQGIFGIHQYGGGMDECYIKANKAGLELFAIQLLKASVKAEHILAHPDKSIIPINYEESWIGNNSEVSLQYIEPIPWKQNSEQNAAGKEVAEDSLGEKLIPYGCMLTAIILVFATLVGLGTIFKWFL